MDKNGHEVFSSNRLRTITVKNIIFLFSCNGATINSEGTSAAEMLYKKTRSASIVAAQNASVRYKRNTGVPELSPGFDISDLGKSFVNLWRFMYSRWVVLSR